MKTTHEILIFKKNDRYDIFLDGESIFENGKMNKDHIRAYFEIEICDHIKQAVESLNGILEGLPSAKRTLIKTEINKLEKLLK